MEAKILLIVESPHVRRNLEEMLSGGNYNRVSLNDAELAFVSVERWAHQFDLVIIEEEMEDKSGLALMCLAHSRRKDLPVIIAAGNESVDGSIYAIAAGAIHYMTEFIDPDVFTIMVEHALGMNLAPSQP